MYLLTGEHLQDQKYLSFPAGYMTWTLLVVFQTMFSLQPMLAIVEEKLPWTE